VHGRAQGKKSEQQLRDEWIPVLQEGSSRLGRELPPASEIRFPFYGARLDELTGESPSLLFDVVTRGDRAPVDEFERELVTAFAQKLGITDADVQRELGPGVVTRGPENWEWVQAIGRLISRRAPAVAAAVIAQVTADVNAYLRRAKVRREINAMFDDAIGPDETIVVSHSLGTVIAYDVLSAMKNRARVPLFVTLGSPLAIEPIKAELISPLGKPAGVKRWVNASDERDPVALHARLEPPQWPAGVDRNHDGVHNPRGDAHSIRGYLSDPSVVQEIAAFL
jgi:hypothetical protein